MQRKITVLMERAKIMKAKLDSKEDLPQITPAISTEYIYKDPQTNKVERNETITLNIEEKLAEFENFYQKTNIDLPPDFAESIKDIWNRNYDQIEQEISQNGFDEILIIPAGLNLTDLSEKMKMQDGYWESNNFKEGGSFAGVKSQNTDKVRLILVHKTQNLKDRPELAQTLNIKGKDVNRDQILTLEDYLIFQRKYFEENQRHLDEDGWTWLATEVGMPAGQAGARLVYSHWNPSNGKLHVLAHHLEHQDENLGARPSRSFY